MNAEHEKAEEDDAIQCKNDAIATYWEFNVRLLLLLLLLAVGEDT